jgi:hypothetical protein
VNVKPAETPAEFFLLVEIDVLIAEENDEMLGQGVVDFLELLVAEWLAQVDALDLGPDDRGQWLDGDGLVGHGVTPAGTFFEGWRSAFREQGYASRQRYASGTVEKT